MPPIGEKALFTKDWQHYRQECLRLAGMPSPIPPRYPGTDFFAIDDFDEENLNWLILQHIKDFIQERPEQIVPFFGGYVLSRQNETLMYPQCCGDLSDIMWWKHICYSSKIVYYNGHPVPEVTFSNSSIQFRCIDDDDPFDNLTKKTFEVNQGELVLAYESVLESLVDFRDKIASHLLGASISIKPIELANTLTISNQELGESNLHTLN